VQLFNREKLHFLRFCQFNEIYAQAQTQSIRVFALFQPTITIAAGLSIALVIWYGGQDTIRGTIRIGILVAYFSYILALFQPVREIADKWNLFLSGMASAERIHSVLSWPVELPHLDSQSDLKPLESVRGEIVFENVWFAYQNEDWVLRDFSFHIAPGERIGVVGSTGAGKTSLISLLMRLYEPQKGRILLDGKDLKSYDRRSLRSAIGVVQQEVFLFSGSFEENISFWGSTSSQSPLVKQLKSLLKLSHLTEGRELPALDERGSNFSMGEKQLIAFVRALAAEPKIWILDEASANLDSATELLLQNALNQASGQCTTLLVAHRLATVRTADRILVLHRGRLIESGSHAQLLQQNGLYAKLYRYQSAAEPAAQSAESALGAHSEGSQVVHSISDSSA
jgi:ABC-type multidrug transport system fused ATPase/permease subunit